ncbi:MAG: LysE family transporter [Campylobacterota bacterium]|nr:LysE family transporter [Campylobacterota bacterium]
MESFIEGMLLGLGAAVPIGVINILIMNTALQSYKGAVAIGFGAMSADILYLGSILLGITAFFNNSTLLNILGIFGAAFLGYMAFVIFDSRNRALEKALKVLNKKSIFGFYLKGFGLTFINPYTVAFWLSIASYTANKNLDTMMSILGLFLAIFLWITLMPYAIHRSKHRISQKVSFAISIISALILGFFAISLMGSVVVEIL